MKIESPRTMSGVFRFAKAGNRTETRYRFKDFYQSLLNILLVVSMLPTPYQGGTSSIVKKRQKDHGSSTIDVAGSDKTVTLLTSELRPARFIGMPVYDCDWEALALQEAAFIESLPFSFSDDVVFDACFSLSLILDGKLHAQPELMDDFMAHFLMSDQPTIYSICGDGSSGCATTGESYVLMQELETARRLRTLFHEFGHWYYNVDTPFELKIGDSNLTFIGFEILADDTASVFGPEIIADILGLSSVRWLFKDTVTADIPEGFDQSGYINNLRRRLGAIEDVPPEITQQFDELVTQFYTGMAFMGQHDKGFEFARLWHEKRIIEALILFSEAFDPTTTPSAEHGLRVLLDMDARLQALFEFVASKE